MGFVRAKGLLGGMKRKLVKEVEFLADTGAFYTTIPPRLADELEIESLIKTKLVLANKQTVEVDVSLAYLKSLERDGVFQVAIMEVLEPLLGATALEGLGVRVDPSTGAIEYSRPYGVALL